MLRILALALVLTSGVAFASEQPPKGTAIANKQVTIAGAVGARAESTVAKPNYNNKPPMGFWERLFSDPVATFTGVLALLTIGMFCVAYRQYISLNRVERAYLFADISAPVGVLSLYNTEPRIITINIWNNGKTPAEIIRVRGYWDVREDVPQKLDDHSISNETLPPGYGIACDKFYPDHITVDVSDTVIQEIEALSKQVYIVGSIAYRDIFKKERVTGYCWVYQPGNQDLPFALEPKSKLNVRT